MGKFDLTERLNVIVFLIVLLMSYLLWC